TGVTQQLARTLGQFSDHLALLGLCRTQLVCCTLALQRALLRTAQPRADVEQRTHVLVLPPRQLIQGPCRDGRLRECAHLLSCVSIAVLLQPACQLVARSRELLQ